MGKHAALILDAIGRDRPFISIKSKVHPEGKNYELFWGDELSPEVIANLQVLADKAQELQPKLENIGRADPAEALQLQEWCDEIMSVIFRTPVEPEVLPELSYLMRMQCLNVFGEVCLSDPQLNQTTTTGKKRTGAK